MTDKELLELAANAAGGLVYVADMGWIHEYADGNRGAWWCPLDNDSDAFRLAVRLGCQLVINPEIGITDCKIGDGAWCFGGEHHHPDGCAATRRAIVRAAAEIGRTK